MEEAIQAAGVQPDRIFITGGSARSPLIKAFIQQKLPKVPLEGRRLRLGRLRPRPLRRAAVPLPADGQARQGAGIAGGHIVALCV